MTARTKWSLNAESLDRLLVALCPDREVAGRRYETVRAGLLRFFSRRVGSMAEALVDETIDRVCRRMEDGEVPERVGAFFYGVARNVLLDHLKVERRREVLRLEAAREHDAGTGDSLPHTPGSSERLYCLRRCLQALGEGDRILIERYYGMDDGDTLAVRAHRAVLADELGISPGNLRVRAHRVRARLEDCCTRCLGIRPGIRLEEHDHD